MSAAERAFPAWAAQSWESRAAILATLADRIEARTDDLARLLTREQGKPIGQAHYEAMQTHGIVRFHAGMTPQERTYRDTTEVFIAQDRGPLGVIAAISA